MWSTSSAWSGEIRAIVGKLPEGGEVRDQALLDEGASGLERFAAFATSQQSLVNPEPVEPLYLRRPDVSVPNPLKHVLNHAGAERTE